MRNCPAAVVEFKKMEIYTFIKCQRHLMFITSGLTKPLANASTKRPGLSNKLKKVRQSSWLSKLTC